MKEAGELTQKEQQRLKEEQEKVKEKRAKHEAEEEQRLQYYELRGDLKNCKAR